MNEVHLRETHIFSVDAFVYRCNIYKGTLKALELTAGERADETIHLSLIRHRCTARAVFARVLLTLVSKYKKCEGTV